MTDADRTILLVVAVATVLNSIVLWWLWREEHRR